MRFGTAAELMALDEALEAFALGVGSDVHNLAGAENLRLELLSGLETFVAANLDQVAMRFEVDFLEHSPLSSAQLAFRDDIESDAGGGATVFLGGAQLRPAAS